METGYSWLVARFDPILGVAIDDHAVYWKRCLPDTGTIIGACVDGGRNCGRNCSRFGPKFFTITATDVVVRRMTKEDELFSTDIFISKCPVGPQDTVKNYNKQK